MSSLDIQESDFQTFRKLIAEEVGIRLSESKKIFLISRLSPRLKELGLISFREYLRLLLDPNTKKEEIGHLINQITTKETRFFRENHHFDYLKETYLPSLIREDIVPLKISFWSAGCATGEEAYSLAMILFEFSKKNPWIQPRIWATDIDSKALDKARSGLFPEKVTRDISPTFLKKYFLKGVGERSGWIKARSLIKNLVDFEYYNLHKPKGHSGRLFHGIFCRNVLIYFLPRSQKRIQEVFYNSLIPGGLLFLGHSELLIDREEKFRSLGKTIYQKIG